MRRVCQARSVWALLRSRAMLYCILYQFLTPLISGIFSTAGAEVKQHWAGVRVLQNAGFSLVGLVLFTFGLYLVKTKLLDRSWFPLTKKNSAVFSYFVGVFCCC